MSKPSNLKTPGRYSGRVFKNSSKSANGIVDVYSAIAVYIDESGVEHHTGYEHPRVRSLRSDDWVLRKGTRHEYGVSVGDVARSFQDFLDENGVRFEIAHPSLWAPGIDEHPPYWADEDDQARDDL